MTITTNDPENYERLRADQFESADEAQKVLGEFVRELGELRNKYRVLDLGYVLTVGCPGANLALIGHLGDQRNMVPMFARAFGYAKAAHERELDVLVDQGARAEKVRDVPDATEDTGRPDTAQTER